MKVVGTMFFENEKLLIDKPRKRPTYQMIGGKVEDGETTLQAAIRECHEELGDEAIFDEEKFELIMEFDEIATSDGITPIHFYVYKYNRNASGICHQTVASGFFSAGKNSNQPICDRIRRLEMDRYNGRCYDSGFIWEYDFISGWRSKGYLIFQQIISDKRGTECGSGSGDRWSKGQFYGESEDEYGIDPQKDTGYEVKSDPEADRNEK